MITGELKRQVDKIWDTLWTAGITSPVTVMEQITYLLFMKLLDDSQLARESNANAFGTAVQDPVFKDGVCVISEQPRIECEYDRLRWSRFSNANPPEMFETVRNYVFEFIKRLGGDEDDTAFGRYMKNAVFLIPTPEVLVSVVDDMSGMQLTDKDTMGDVYEELLKKMAAAVKDIKLAILQARAKAARLANAEALKLYFFVGGYISKPKSQTAG